MCKFLAIATEPHRCESRQRAPQLARDKSKKSNFLKPQQFSALDVSTIQTQLSSSAVLARQYKTERDKIAYLLHFEAKYDLMEINISAIKWKPEMLKVKI